MFVSISANGVATLEEIDDFRSLEVRSQLPQGADQAALARIGRPDGHHLWLPGDWIRSRGRADDPAWLGGYGKMMAFAKRSGWIDESGAVRAHVKHL